LPLLKFQPSYVTNFVFEQSVFLQYDAASAGNRIPDVSRQRSAIICKKQNVQIEFLIMLEHSDP